MIGAALALWAGAVFGCSLGVTEGDYVGGKGDGGDPGRSAEIVVRTTSKVEPTGDSFELTPPEGTASGDFLFYLVGSTLEAYPLTPDGFENLADLQSACAGKRFRVLFRVAGADRSATKVTFKDPGTFSVSVRTIVVSAPGLEPTIRAKSAGAATNIESGQTFHAPPFNVGLADVPGKAILGYESQPSARTPEGSTLIGRLEAASFFALPVSSAGEIKPPELVIDGSSCGWAYAVYFKNR